MSVTSMGLASQPAAVLMEVKMEMVCSKEHVLMAIPVNLTEHVKKEVVRFKAGSKEMVCNKVHVLLDRFVTMTELAGQQAARSTAFSKAMESDEDRAIMDISVTQMDLAEDKVALLMVALMVT